MFTGEKASSKCIGTMKAGDGESLVDLKVQLEKKKVLKFYYKYWDPNECCRVEIPFESLNDIEPSVYMIPALNKEVSDPASKQQSVQDQHELNTIN